MQCLYGSNNSLKESWLSDVCSGVIVSFWLEDFHWLVCLMLLHVRAEGVLLMTVLGQFPGENDSAMH